VRPVPSVRIWRVAVLGWRFDSRRMPGVFMVVICHVGLCIRESLRIPIPCMPLIPGMLPIPGIACCGADSVFPQAATTSAAVSPTISVLFILPPPNPPILGGATGSR